MLVPISWLKEYVDVENIDVHEFSDKMILSGSNVEEVSRFGEDIKGIVIGKIVKEEKHPDADKLLIVQVDVGNETIQIVTGATNVHEGDYVPVVLSGGMLPDGKKIKKGKLRGVESDGMLCSAKELGFPDKVIPTAHKDGIFILDKDYKPGMDFVEALELIEDTIDFEITPNRPDCLSMLGIAREAAAVYLKKVMYPSAKIVNEEDSIEKYISVEIKRPDLCRRYTGRVVKDVKVEQSPWWMQKRLINGGVRPISNIVDITNYVMLEYGVPIHAFDLSDITQKKIVVNTAAEGQKFVTLDGTERILDKETLLINDGEKGVALAGIMGGLNSEIKDDTKTIFIEVACFDSAGIRRTSKKIGLRTEASARFEKGTDPNLCLEVVNRVCQLIEELGAGTIVKGVCDEYPETIKSPVTKVRTERVNGLLGINLTTEEMADIFKRLEMSVEIQGKVMTVTPPTVRLDLLEEIDYVEEVARIYGYDNLPSTLPGDSAKSGKGDKWALEDLTKDTLIALGLNEIQTYSFVSPKGVDKIECPEDSEQRKFVKLVNPLGEENSVMRTTLIPNLLDVLERNNTRNIESAAAFELGRIFINSNKAGDGLPEEPKSLVIGMYGAKVDFFEIKGVVQAMLDKIGIKDACFIVEINNRTFHPGRCAKILIGEKTLGVIGEISAEVVEKYNLPERVYVCELNFDEIFNTADTEKLYSPLPKYPSIERDIAVVVEDKVLAGDIAAIILENGGKLLEKVELFDIYKGKQVEDGFKSMAYALRYRDQGKTLTDEDIAPTHERILNSLKEKLGAILREM